ncbi:precorrin-2 C(20)-methyltransferase [Desulfomarina sp.]
MQGTFYLIGVGPGDPELMTLKAVRTLEKCDIWFVPSAYKHGGSMALSIAAGEVESTGKTILSHHFPMKQVHRGKRPETEVDNAWREAAETILAYLQSGKDVAFPTLGDPAIYSTGFYVCETLEKLGHPFSVKIVPGVSAIGASSAVTATPLCLGDEKLVVIPATFEDCEIEKILEASDTIVFMKVHKVMARLAGLLDRLDLLHKAVLVERCSLGDQKIWSDISQAVGREIHYFSTIIVRKT